METSGNGWFQEALRVRTELAGRGETERKSSDWADLNADCMIETDWSKTARRPSVTKKH